MSVGLTMEEKHRIPSSQKQRSRGHQMQSKLRKESGMAAQKFLLSVLTENKLTREFLAELLSTFVLMMFGLGSVAQVVLGKQDFGDFLSINLGFGFGVTMGIHVAGGISGAHMNAAITFTSCVLGQLPWKKLPVYVLGQFLGSFLASGTVFLLYKDALYSFSGGNLTVTGPTSTAGIFSTYPAPYMDLLGGFVNELIATGMLQLCILAITDKKNSAALDGTQALVIGLLVAIIGMSMGMNTGYAINPSRDLPPRIFTAIAGWGMDVFRASNSWWWVPLIAPTIGSVIGALIYKILIDHHNRSAPQPESHLTLPSEPEPEATCIGLEMKA
ncbi:aquaporin-7-like isoform X1 [Tachyglossus aculeatus]|uniref:aquaporin-7-like isoform X1 n=2 Tax=Tachyglossus aculeatus TaxID=9261 RepID=UPI0018F5D8BC|nr:aquaporin-7-like isoform X1 [Tachyglossus aculeatus]